MFIAAFKPLSGRTSLVVQRLNNQGGCRGWLAQFALLLVAGRLLCWLHTREVERQLAFRSEQVWAVWLTAGFEPHLAKQLCDAIQDTAGWSKPWFVPEDSLDLVLDLAFDFLGLVEFIHVCERQLGVTLEPQSLQDCRNLGDVALVLAASRVGSCTDGDRAANR